MRITVYTCILNGFDNLHAPADEAMIRSNARYICFTNQPHVEPLPPWEFRPAYSALSSPSRNSRVPKILPHLLLPESDFTIWHDGCFALRRRPEEIVEKELNGSDIAVHKHPARDCLYDEAQLCIDEKIGDPLELAAQVEQYRRNGHPEHSGLWACGMIVRRESPDMVAFNELWWKLFQQGSARDQISFAAAVWASGIHIATLGHDVWSGPNMRYFWHNAFKGRGDVDSFAQQRAKVRFKLDRLNAIVGGEPGVALP